MLNYRDVASVSFPLFSQDYVNMMPIVMGDWKSVPPALSRYLPMIEACDLPKSEIGKIGYLTIDESFVQPGHSHRRSGIHTEGTADHSWGGGGWGGAGGLYMANSVDETCAIYDAYCTESDRLGRITPYDLPQPILMPKNRLYWIHDRTPHESLPFRTSWPHHRQFFRLVTHDVGVWYANHSTPNPLGVKPAARVVRGDKFRLAAGPLPA